MANEYVPIFFDWMEVTEELNAQEKGRLIDAIVLYASGGDWQEQIKGNERYLFPAFRRHIDRANSISAKRSTAGAIGGKQTEANRSKHKQTEANASKNAKEEEKEEEKEYKEDEDGYPSAPAHRFGADLSPSEIQTALENDRLIEDAAKDWGLPCNPGNLIKARDLAREYTLQWVLEAMQRSGNGKSQTWAYVEGILRSFRENGGPDAPRAAKGANTAGKRTSAQNYQQREYTESELMAASGDLIAEARQLRDTMRTEANA